MTGTLEQAQVSFLTEAIGATGALRAAGELGLPARLTGAPVADDRLEKDLQVDVRRLQQLLAALAALGVVEERAQGWVARPGLDALVDATFAWDDLTAVMRSGRSRMAVDTPAGAAEHYPGLVRLFTSMEGAAAEAAADVLVPARRVLDVGAGAATWSLALSRRDPRCRVAALDLPEVVATTRRAVAAAHAEGRFTYLAGDVMTVDLPGGEFDLVVTANLCHLFGPETNRRLFARLRSALAVGGRLAVIDVLPEGQVPDGRAVALHRLSLALRTDTGALHTVADYTSWLHGAGLELAGRHPLPGGLGLGLLVASLPKGRSVDAVVHGVPHG